jgi:hypothetical protein
VKWYRDRSARNRAREEREILEEEFKRSIRSFENLSTVWTALAKEAAIQPGKAAYGHKQAAMYRQLAQNCQERQKIAISKAEEYDKWYVTVTSSQDLY